MAAPLVPELLAPALAVIAPLLTRPATADGGHDEHGGHDPHDARVDRIIVGLTGSPAAGKSTLAAALAAEFQAQPPRGLGAGGAVAVPMDGFHLSNVELARLGLAHRKGAPQTFDAAGFVHLIRRIRAGGELVYAPGFDRAVNEAVTGMIPVFVDTRLVVVEGNYLLLAQPPWSGLRPLFDLVIYLEAPAEQRLDLLLRRQRLRGLGDAAAHDWVFDSDEANARLIEETRQYADVVLSRDE